MDKKNEIPHCFNRAVLTSAKHTVSDKKKTNLFQISKWKKKAVIAITAGFLQKQGRAGEKKFLNLKINFSSVH